MTTISAPRARPIIFSTKMILAITLGKKFVTRRYLQRNPPKFFLGASATSFRVADGFSLGMNDRYWPKETGQGILHCPYGEAGDSLWIREEWSVASEYNLLPPRDIPSIAYQDVKYRTSVDCNAVTGRWRSAMHMPRCASRITLRVTSTDLRRLQNMTEKDALAEGVDDLESFIGTWDTIHGSGSWHLNPWVWVVAFERCVV